jgi:hypothetical protein
MEVADKLRSDYEFGHTLHANHLPRGDAAVERPLVRLFKPFDELVVDSKVILFNKSLFIGTHLGCHTYELLGIEILILHFAGF